MKDDNVMASTIQKYEPGDVSVSIPLIDDAVKIICGR